jgi:hypothetical protein
LKHDIRPTIGARLTAILTGECPDVPRNTDQPNVSPVQLSDDEAGHLTDVAAIESLGLTELREAVGPAIWAAFEHLYEEAAISEGHFHATLSRIAKRLGFAFAGPANQAELRLLLSQAGGAVIVGPKKREQVALGKAIVNNQGRVSALLDVLRATIAVDFFDQLPQVAQVVREEFDCPARMTTDRLSAPRPNGYSDFQVCVHLPTGFVVEVQLHVKGVLMVKELPQPGLPPEHEVFARLRRRLEGARIPAEVAAAKEEYRRQMEPYQHL